MNIRKALTMVALAAAPFTSADAQVWGTNSNMELVGSRTGTQLEIGGWTAFLASWNISAVGSHWSYQYTFDQTGTQEFAISHLILGLTTNCTTIGSTSSSCIWNASWEGNQNSFNTWGAAPSNPGFPDAQSFWGIKFDGMSPGAALSISFMSDRAPVWGDFYAKGGQQYAFNDGLLEGNRNSNDINLFIARPNGLTTTTTIPEPSTYALMAAGLAGLGFAARRRRRA